MASSGSLNELHFSKRLRSMSFTMHGVGVSHGIAIGRAHLVSHALLEVAHYQIPKKAIEQEITRLEQAVQTVRQDLENIRSQLPASAPAELGAFVSTHLMILADRTLSEEPKNINRSELCNAEWAVKQQMENVVAQFEQIEDEYLRERKQDVVQVVERIIKALLGHPSQAPLKPQESAIILVAHALSPADDIQ